MVWPFNRSQAKTQVGLKTPDLGSCLVKLKKPTKTGVVVSGLNRINCRLAIASHMIISSGYYT